MAASCSSSSSKTDLLQVGAFFYSSKRWVLGKSAPNLYGKLADIEFEMFQRLPEELPESFPWKMSDPDRLRSPGEKVKIFAGKTQNIIYPGIERVLVNATFSPDIEFQLPEWKVLIDPITQICLKIFPNLKIEKSSFNIHMGVTHYNAVYQSFPFQKDKNFFLLEPKVQIFDSEWF